MRPARLFRTTLFLAMFSIATAALAKPTAEGFVKTKQSELVALVQDDSASSQKKVSAIFDQILDYDSLARESLDEHWTERTEAERAEFTDVLKQLVQRAYKKNLKKTVGYEVQFEGASASGKGHLVKTLARSKTDKRQEPISIDYVLHEVEGQWRITDIVTEGSSLVTNYRRQFDRVIDKKGFAELLERMKRKLDEG